MSYVGSVAFEKRSKKRIQSQMLQDRRLSVNEEEEQKEESSKEGSGGERSISKRRIKDLESNGFGKKSFISPPKCSKGLFCNDH